MELRFFGGLNVEETAEYLGISPKTVKRDWSVAKAWLHGFWKRIKMTPEKWETVKNLFGAALELRAPERSAFLLARSTDKEVRAEVERLLKEYEEAETEFLSNAPAFSISAQSNLPPKRLREGETLCGRFRIIRFVAQGGMGEIYEAQDERLNRVVALKFLPEDFAQDVGMLKRLEREAKAASALNHPNICTVYDFGEDSGRTFITMEYLEGESLSDRLKRGPLPLSEALKTAIAVAGALAAAHRKGIIHRDLKPGNLMITSTGVKLLDFGLAKLNTVQRVMTRTITALTRGHVVGTLPYMSPERLHGEEADTRGDIFAFGAVLYEMLAGRRAFQGQSNIETIAAIDRGETRPLQEFVKNVPQELVRVIGRCLRREPQERYASISEIQRELEDCFAIVPGASSGINLKVLLRQSKRPRVAVPTILILLILIGLTVWGIHRSYRTRWARNEALPKIAQLAEQEKFGEAYTLAVQAERYIPKDPVLTKLWPDISWSESIHTTPQGALVYRRDYNTQGAAWEFVGRTPIENHRFPLVDSRWKFELRHFTTVDESHSRISQIRVSH